MPYLEARVERYYTREKAGIKILIGTSICIIGASLDETSLMSTVVQNDGIIAIKRYLSRGTL